LLVAGLAVTISGGIIVAHILWLAYDSTIHISSGFIIWLNTNIYYIKSYSKYNTKKLKIKKNDSLQHVTVYSSVLAL